MFEVVILWSLTCLMQTQPLFNGANKTIPTSFSTHQKIISQRDELWFVGFFILTRCDLLGPYGNFSYFCEVLRTWILTLRWNCFVHFGVNGKFLRDDFLEIQKLVSLIKRYRWKAVTLSFLHVLSVLDVNMGILLSKSCQVYSFISKAPIFGKSQFHQLTDTSLTSIPTGGCFGHCGFLDNPVVFKYSNGHQT